MGICKDSSLTYLNQYGYNVIRLPRPGIEPMQVLGRGQSLEMLGNLSSIWNTTESVPAPGAPTALPDIENKRSDKLELSIGLRILANAIQGFSGAMPTLDTVFNRARRVQFTYSNVTSTAVLPLDAGNYLASGDLKSANPLVSSYFLGEDGEAFLIVDVLKSDTVTITATSAKDLGVALDVPALQNAVGGKVKVQSGGQDESAITFKGPQPITFGFKAFVIAFVGGRWTLKGAKASQNLAFDVEAPESVEEEEENLGVLFTTSGLTSL